MARLLTGVFGGSSPADGATETTVVTLDPDGRMVVPEDAPSWLTRAAYVRYDHHGDDLLGIEPVSAGTENVRPVEDVDGGVAFAVADPLREYGLDPETLPDPFEVRVAYDPDARRVLVDVDALVDALVAGIDGGEKTISACPRP